MKENCKKNIFRIIFLFLALMCTAWIFSNSLETASESSKKSTNVVLIIEKVLRTDVSEHFVRKAAHFSEYALQAFLIYYTFYFFCQKKEKSFLCLPLSLLTAIIDEWLQSFSYGRSPQVTDVCIDFCGALVGALVAFLLLIIIFSIKNKRQKEFK